MDHHQDGWRCQTCGNGDRSHDALDCAARWEAHVSRSEMYDQD